MPRGIPNKKIEEEKDWRVKRDERQIESSKTHYVVEITSAEWATLRSLLINPDIFHRQAVSAVAPILDKVDRQISIQQQPILFPKEIN